jgi:hypothetical protein
MNSILARDRAIKAFIKNAPLKVRLKNTIRTTYRDMVLYHKVKNFSIKHILKFIYFLVPKTHLDKCDKNQDWWYKIRPHSNYSLYVRALIKINNFLYKIWNTKK